MSGSAESLQAAANEGAETPLELGTAFTFGAKAEMATEVLLLPFSECAVEEEVDDASYIIANHQSVSSLLGDDIHRPATLARGLEFLRK
jgi:hypothetical protein